MKYDKILIFYPNDSQCIYQYISSNDENCFYYPNEKPISNAA